jgi:hypothetical protein
MVQAAEQTIITTKKGKGAYENADQICAKRELAHTSAMQAVLNCGEFKEPAQIAA